MSDLNTELMKTLLEKESVDEFFRNMLEEAINELLKAELGAFLGYDKYNSSGWGSGDSRNGTYDREFDTKYGKLHLKIPRDREGGFKQQLIPKYERRSDDLETAIIHLYKKGITTREISDLIEKMYGQHYCAATVSNITQMVGEQVKAFHEKAVKARMAVIFCDATWLNVRRDSVDKEALHVILGITPDGYKEILDYALYPSESASNYEQMLQNLKERGLSEVLLFVSDGLQGMADALKRQFPKADHQNCWVHLDRNVSHLIRKKDRETILDELKKVYTAETKEDAEKELQEFIKRNSRNYPKLAGVFRNRSSLFSFFTYPEEIRRSIYTTNLIESNNKALKKRMKVKEQFPDEDAADRFFCTHYAEYNRKHGLRRHKGFVQAEPDLLDLMDQRYHPEKGDAATAAA